MIHSRTRHLLIVCFCLMAASLLAEEPCLHIRVAKVNSIFAIAPSPVGRDVLFYGSTEGAEGELIAGKMFRLRLSKPGSDVLPFAVPSASNPVPPVWKRDGSSAYFETDRGVYRLKSADGLPLMLLKEPSVGLAISSDDHLLAFWRIEKGADTLVVYNLQKGKVTRTWRVPDHFDSDKSGWDLAFAPDSSILYARTYDETSSTPLKSFDIASGKVETVSPNSYAVAAASEAVYFIAVSDTGRSLRKIIPGTNQSKIVATDFGYDTLSSSGKLGWFAAQDYRTRETVIVDAAIDAIKSIGKRESVAVLPDGRLLSAIGSQITIGDTSCKPEMRTEKSDLSDEIVAYVLPNTQKYLESIAGAAGLEGVNISATTNGQHPSGSDHYGGTAIDINEVDGQSVIEAGTNSALAAHIRSLQDAANSVVVGVAHENYGPSGLYKDGRQIINPVLQSQHENHVHISAPTRTKDDN